MAAWACLPCCRAWHQWGTHACRPWEWPFRSALTGPVRPAVLSSRTCSRRTLKQQIMVKVRILDKHKIAHFIHWFIEVLNLFICNRNCHETTHTRVQYRCLTLYCRIILRHNKDVAHSLQFDFAHVSLLFIYHLFLHVMHAISQRLNARKEIQNVCKILIVVWNNKIF